MRLKKLAEIFFLAAMFSLCVYGIASAIIAPPPYGPVPVPVPPPPPPPPPDYYYQRELARRDQMRWEHERRERERLEWEAREFERRAYEEQMRRDWERKRRHDREAEIMGEIFTEIIRNNRK